jgi:hypothetical protein
VVDTNDWNQERRIWTSKALIERIGSVWRPQPEEVAEEVLPIVAAEEHLEDARRRPRAG